MLIRICLNEGKDQIENFKGGCETMNYKPLTLPELSWNKKVSTETFGELVVQPLGSGYGITIGNALRRVMLSSVEGAAVTSVVIKGVNNEFSCLKGLREDVLN